MNSELDRFVHAQDGVYESVLKELRAGRKVTHWMWYVFPQVEGLGTSHMASKYAIESKSEACAYLGHPVLGPRLEECTKLVLQIPHDSLRNIFGYPDDLKFRSCMTLFSQCIDRRSIFSDALEKFCNGRPDDRTLAILQNQDSPI